jgi:hypothetical protein
MKIKEIFCKSNNKIMSVKEVAEHDKHDTLKYSLMCATPGCNAKMSFVSGSAGRHDHFRKVRYEEHSTDCYIQNIEKELKERIEATEKIAVSLDEKAIQQRVMYFFKKRTENKDQKDSNKKSSKSSKTENTNSISGQSTVLGGNDSPKLSDLKKEKKTLSPRVTPRLLNQISEQDEGKFIHLSASIKKVRKIKTSFELDLYLGDSKATLVITEAFIKASRDTQVNDYLMSLMKFTDIEKETTFDVSVYVFCMFNLYERNNTIIFADNFDQFYLSVSGTRSRPIKLDSFQAGIIRGNWKK